MTEKMLGKITEIKFGIAGYQDAMLGIHFTFTSKNTGVSTTKSYWDYNLIQVSDYAKWTEEDRKEAYAGIMYFVSNLLKEAKVNDVMKLMHVPVELTIENNQLKDWRILTEVI